MGDQKKSISTTATDLDRECASIARAALFPERMHRDSGDTSHFPALLQLDMLRESVLENAPHASISALFPRHVVVVRNLADEGIQWNGKPDYDDPSNVSFTVVPDVLSVRCTSNCGDFAEDKSLRGFRRTFSRGQEILLCSDRVMNRDHTDAKYRGVAKDLPPKSFQTVEEVLSHHLVHIRHDQVAGKGNRDGGLSADVDVEAVRAGECYFSRHDYDGNTQTKRGSRLQIGYSWLPSVAQNWSMGRCISNAALRSLLSRKPSLPKREAQQAVADALRESKKNQPSE